MRTCVIISFSIILFSLTCFNGCTNSHTYIEKTVDEILREYSANPKEFVVNYKNKRVCIDGYVGFATQSKEHPGNKYYMIFDCDTFNYSKLDGFYISCSLKSNTLGFPGKARGKHVKVNCTFKEAFIRDEYNIKELVFHNGQTVDE